MKQLFSLSLMLFMCVNLLLAQGVADTFLVSGQPFFAPHISGWSSLHVSNNIQADTAWNYICKRDDYSPIASSIGVQFVNNSNETPTKKEIRKFKHSCKTFSTVILRWSVRILDFKKVKVPGCPACGPAKTLGYSIPLNPCQTLNFVLSTGANNAYPAVKDSFLNFITRFLKVNAFALGKFDVIDFTSLLPIDTLKVGIYTLNLLVPENFKHERLHENGSGLSTLTYLSPCDHFFTLSVGAQTNQMTVKNNIYYLGADFSISDTAVVVETLKTEGNPKNIFLVRTRRKITYAANSFVVVQVSIPVQGRDEVTFNYCKHIVRKYADRLVVLNSKYVPLSPDKFKKVNQGLPKPK